MYKNIYIMMLLIVTALAACDSDEESTAASFSMSVTEAVVGSAITFDASPSEGNFESFEWNFGDGSVGNGEIVQHTYLVAKLYTVTLMAHTSSGGVKTASAQLDIYRVGRTLAITKTYPGYTTQSVVWVESVYPSSANPVEFKAAIVVAHDSRPHRVQSETFGIVLPSDYLGYEGFQIHPQRSDYTLIQVATSGEVVFFRYFDPDWQCFENTFKVAIIEVNLKKAGTGKIEFYDPFGIECLAGYKLHLANWGADFEISTTKNYD